LETVTIPGQQSAALWIGGRPAPDGRGVLEPAGAAPLLGTSGGPARVGVSALRTVGNVVFYDLATDVPDTASPARSASADSGDRGYVVIRRTLSSAQTSAILSGLIGEGARLQMGNRDGSVWTDWSAVVPTPPIDLTRLTKAEYRAADGWVVGSLAPVASAPWVVWVELSQTVLLAPARTLLLRMLAMALVGVVLGALLIGIASTRITTPLHALTVAAEAIAAGDYSRRVVSRRRDEIGRLGAAFNVMSAHVQVTHEELERRVRQRTEELEGTLKQLESFSYSVSHDLRAPLRAISGFSRILLSEHLDTMSGEAAAHLRRVADGARQMGQLVDDLLAFARLGRAPVRRVRTDPAEIARDVLGDLEPEYADRGVRVSVADLPPCDADPALLKQVYVNLLSNALKFTRERENASVEVGCRTGESPTVYFVKDNGVGFDMQYADKLFGVFQRLHLQEEFEGTGAGLAIVQRIIRRHDGRVWAESDMGKGTTMYFTIGTDPSAADAA
jgi:signal transduction histidine kinase